MILLLTNQLFNNPFRFPFCFSNLLLPPYLTIFLHHVFKSFALVILFEVHTFRMDDRRMLQEAVLNLSCDDLG